MTLPAGQILTATLDAAARRLAAHGFGADCRHQGDWPSIVILNVAGARSSLDLIGGGYVQWHYEPRTGPATDPGALVAVVLRVLGMPTATLTASAYRAFPLQGAAGRHLEDHGLTVDLLIHQDLESFEAPTELQITSLARPERGSVLLNDNGDLRWQCDYHAAFSGDAGKVVDTIAPLLHRAPRPRRQTA
jgi:hypothetical protein